jgi:hypothetical protein
MSTSDQTFLRLITNEIIAKKLDNGYKRTSPPADFCTSIVGKQVIGQPNS